jgi:ribosomal protein S7
MPRRREVPKREILPDPKFGSIDLSKFMNVIMESGKKAVAEAIIYGALDAAGVAKRRQSRSKYGAKRPKKA